MPVALIAGSTGLVGKQLLSLLLEGDHYDQVIALTRKPIEVNHPRLKNVVIDFNKLEEYHTELKADDIFCCLGTTIKKAKSKEAFRKVDLEYPYELGRIGKALGASQYLIVSALGADKNSSVFYNQVKGEVEEKIGTLYFLSYHIFRPSLLLGDRQEERAGEDAAKIFFKWLGFLVPKKYKGIEAIKVAKAMEKFAIQQHPGKHIHESITMQNF